MMNNGWYIVKPDTDRESNIVFRHPLDPEGDNGWMKPSTENRLAAAKQDSGVPDKQFTRQEIEKHNSRDDLWLVVNGNVYDATSVLSWHPGGAQPLIANAGKLSMEATTNFESIHDEYAHKKLQECAIGRVTDKAMRFMQEQAKAEAEERAKSGGDSEIFLQSKKWVPVKLNNKKQVSEDTFTYTFEYDNYKHRLGLGTCQHIQFGIHMLDKMLVRPYTPTRPINETDEDGTFDLTVKTYFPDENQPGGAFSNFLCTLPIGEFVDVCGPTGEIKYKGKGKFEIEGQEKTFKRISLVLGGSGLTPGFSLLGRIFEDGDDKTEVRVVDANKTEGDILLHDQLNKMVKETKGQIQIAHVLSHPKNQDEWKRQGGLCGHVNADMIKEKLFEPSDDSVVFLCGPPAMIQTSALPALTSKSFSGPFCVSTWTSLTGHSADWGYKEDENCFGF
jgi:nitrate reductase (NAD(P)H)